METDLITRAQAGEGTAVSALYALYQVQIFQYLYYRVGERQAADDLTAEVFTRAIEALSRYRLQGMPFRAWLFRIAHNLTIDHYRRAGRWAHVALTDQIPAEGSTPEEAAELALTGTRLYRALQTLKPSQREVIILRFVIDLSVAEAAQALGKTEDSVKCLQWRGLRTLREVLQKEGLTYE